jgi:uncharacterized protein (PEP-CTERM system associated)
LWHCDADTPRIGIPMPRPALRLLALTLLLAAGSAARAQGLYPPGAGGYLSPAGGGAGYVPPAGIDTRVGDLRGYFAQAFGNAPAPVAPAITYTAGIDVSETYDTNAVTSDKGTHDFITQITPAFGVTADTARITGNLFFNPSLEIFAYHGNQNHVAENLNAAATAILLPDWLFLDVRAYAADQPISGYGYSSAGVSSTALSRSNSVLTTSYSAAPTLRHRFGGTAVVEAGYSIAYTSYGGYGNNTTATQQGLTQSSITEGEHALISTGEDFGQWNDTLSASGSQSTGSGALSTSHDNNITNTVSYAVTESLSVHGSIGHENIAYSGSGYNVNDTTWNAGVHWVPNPDSSIDASYGRSQGENSLSLNASYAAAPHTLVFASYSQSVGTNVSNLQRGVALTSVGPSGVTVLNSNGTPVLLNNNFAGVFPGLFRTTTASISAAVTHPRDIYSITLSHSNNSQLASGITGSTTNNSTISTFGTASWGHDLSPDMHSNVLAEYGMNSGQGVDNQGFGNNQSSYTLSVSLTYSISDTLSLSASFTQTNSPSGFTSTGTGGHSGSREIAVVSLHKTIF